MVITYQTGIIRQLLHILVTPVLLGLLGVIVLSAGHTALAGDGKDRDNANGKGWQKGTLKAYDTHGLPRDKRPYDLRAEIGLDMPHKKARQSIRLLPKNYQSTPLRNLVIAALTARIDGDSITRGEQVPAGRDLLTLRLEALNTMGAYVHAFRLYAALEQDIAHPALLKAGIRAQLGLGRHSLACLEAKAGLQSLKKNKHVTIQPGQPFWRQMQALCQPIIDQSLLAAYKNNSTEDTQALLQWDEDSDIPAAWRELNAYSAPQIAAIMRTHANHLTRLDGTPNDLTPEKLAMLAHSAESPVRLQYRLIHTAAKRKLITAQQWQDFLARTNSRLEQEKSATDRNKLPTTLQKLLILSQHYRAAQRGESIPPAAERAEIFGQLYSNVAVSALMAFESLLKEPEDTTLALNHQNAAMSVYLRANRFLATENWKIGQTPVNDAAQATEDSNGLTQQYERLVLFALRDQDTLGPVLAFFKGCLRTKSCSMPDYDYIQTLSLFLEKLKSGLANSISPDEIYDKEKGLTFRSRYVMHSIGLRNNIREMDTKKGLGKAIFLSTLALHREDNDKLDPYFLGSVLEKLRDAGINRFGRDFAITYLIGTLENKGV